jgi:uncharacterized protein YjdB
MRHATIRLLLIFFPLVLAACSTDDPTRSNDFLALTSISITSEHEGIANLTDNQFTATGDYSGELSKDITTAVTWGSSDENILTIDAAGLATALAPGTVRLTATLEGVESSLAFRVSAAGIVSLTVTPASQSAPVGVERDYHVSGTFDDTSAQNLDRIASWSSLDPAIASVTDTGRATGIAVGTADIQAEWLGVTDVATLTVTEAELVALVIDPPAAEYPAGLSVEYTLTGSYSDGTSIDLTDQAYWTSDDETNATVDNAAGEKGTVTTLASGLTDIIASYTDEVTGEWEASTGLEVNHATLREILLFATIYDANGGLVSEDVAIDAGERLDISSDQTLQFTAIGEYTDNAEYDITRQANWASGDTSIVTISNSAGFEGTAMPGDKTGEAGIIVSFADLEISFTLDVNQQ